jgi:hypothetical protein
MSGYEVRITGLDALVRFLGGVVRLVRRFAVVTIVAVALIAALLARGGFGAAELVVTIVLLAPPALLLFFAAGLSELLRLPDRLRRLPREGTTQLAELSRLAGEARTARLRRAPWVLWRLRGAVGSTRDLVGFALPLRVLTPPFLGLVLLASLCCLVLLGVGVIALIVLALG